MFSKAKVYPDSRRVRGMRIPVEESNSQMVEQFQNTRDTRNLSAMGLRNQSQLEVNNTARDINTNEINYTQYGNNEAIQAKINRDMTPNPNAKRYLPVIPKKGVFNEWAAVMRHQDEMDREQERQEYALNKVSSNFNVSLLFEN